MIKAAMVIAIGGAALLGAGCAGNTDEATNVGAHSAQLNGHGQANSGPAFSYFEYWKTANPANKLKTPTRNWPAGAQGSISERPQHLSESTAYSYRVCGNDQGKNPICTSTRQFNTGAAHSHLDYNGSTGRWEFQDDPGVNSDLIVDLLEYGQLFSEHYCAERTCGSQIVAPSCSEGQNSENSWVVCQSHPVAIKLGDLDDKAGIGLWPDGATIDGGSGDDSLTSRSRPTTLTGGPGRDALTTASGNDTINARSAIPWFDADIDASISCGFGDDTVIADRQDPISAGQNGCEHVSKP